MKKDKKKIIDLIPVYLVIPVNFFSASQRLRVDFIYSKESFKEMKRGIFRFEIRLWFRPSKFFCLAAAFPNRA